MLGGYWIYQEGKVKKELNYPFVKGDFSVNASNFFLLFFMGFSGGLIAGGFGVGAGIIINIALTHLDVHQPVASGTSMFTTM